MLTSSKLNFFPIVLLIGIVSFVLFKIPHLYLPFYYDEAWVYAPAIKAMYHQVPSIMPGTISVELSRGHPLVFHFLGGCWAKVFGIGNFSIHSFALFISVFLVIAVYLIGERLFNKETAFAASILLLVQPLFLGQSALLLPEILISLLVLSTIYFFLNGKNILFILSTTLLLLTKESGWILLIALIGWTFIQHFFIENRKLFSTSFIKKFYLLLVPVFVVAIYYFFQWKKFGWLLYPEHVQMLNFSWSYFREHFILSYNFLLEDQGRKVITIGVLIIFLLFYKRIPLWHRILFAFVMVACVKIFFNAWKLPFVLMLMSCIISIIIIFYFSFLTSAKSTGIKGSALSIFFIFSILYLLFTSVNFFTLRYLMCLLPLYLLLISYLLNISLIDKKWVFYSLFSSATALGIYQSSQIKMSGDINLTYVDITKVQIDVVNYFEKNNLHDKVIYDGYIHTVALTNKDAGFLNERPFTNVHSTFTDTTQYAIISNYQPSNYNKVIPSSPDFIRLVRIEKGNFWAELYKRKNT